MCIRDRARGLFFRISVGQTSRNARTFSGEREARRIPASFWITASAASVSYTHLYSTAVGLFNSVVNVILLIFVNWVVKKLNDGEGL